MNQKKYKIILSGGGTGGHIYPAVSVAEALKRRLGDHVEFLFVGANGKMEMEKIPALGYRIIGLPVAGIKRRLALSNFVLPLNIARSLRGARAALHEFDADIAVGFGGYASGPVLWSAQRMGLPTVIQEQNSFAGVTNKLLAKRARKICVAYDGMERFFPADKIVVTGNPLRFHFANPATQRSEAYQHFGLCPDKPVLLIVGGSLGTRTLNNAMKEWVDRITSEGKVQVIWQTGRYYQAELDEFMKDRRSDGTWRGTFIDRMDLAYAAADVVISRSGACSVSELCLVGKPVIFVPSPNVAEDHQTSNAMALVEKNAALLVADDKAVKEAIPAAIALLYDENRRKELSQNIARLAIEDSAERVADVIMEILELK